MGPQTAPDPKSRIFPISVTEHLPKLIKLENRDRLESSSCGSGVPSPPMLDHDRSGTRIAVDRHSATDRGRVENHGILLEKSVFVAFGLF